MNLVSFAAVGRGKVLDMKRFYGKLAKTVVAVVLVAAAVMTGLSGMRLIEGHVIKMSLKEMMGKVSYEESENAASYVLEEADTILKSFEAGELYCRDDGAYDGSETIDIDRLSEGVASDDKSADTEYALGDLDAFYYTAGYGALSYLVDSAEAMVTGDGSYGDYGEDVTVDAEVSESDGIRFDAENYGDGDYATYSMDGITLYDYPTLWEVLYNNGSSIEERYILNGKAETLADLVDANETGYAKETVLLGYYKKLLNAADGLHSYLNGLEQSNALLYIGDSETGKIYTNNDGWRNLTLAQVKKQYEEDYKDGMLYYMRDGDSHTCVAAKEMNGYGNDFADFVADELGEGYDQIFMALDGSYPLKTSDSYYRSLMYAWWDSFPILGSVNALALALVSLAVLVLMLVLLSLQTGRTKTGDGIRAVPMDRFSIEIMMGCDVVFWSLVAWGIVNAIDSSGWAFYYGETDTANLLTQYMIGGAVAIALGAVLLAWELKRYGRRIKERALGGSIIKFAAKRIRKLAVGFRRTQKEQRKMMVRFAIFAVAQCVGWCLVSVTAYWDIVAATVILTILIILFDLYVLYRLVRTAMGREEIRTGMRKIAAGDLDYQIDTGDLVEDCRPMAEELNSVREGIRQAVEVEMKSERLKTDLITNVSHDIKTPLTSIINYVDLLKRENLQDERLAGYVDILDQKSQRLKQLVEDLVESSKITSGNVTLDMRKIDFKELIIQVSGEFDEKFRERNLTLVMDLTDDDMTITADGMRMYRVLENLYANAAKYAMPGSRVYVGGEASDLKVAFYIKNMSENQLNFDADELMERFVRGDVSRTTEGSGLGLEIARNLTTMQGGELELYLDGDLFKVTVSFPVA